MRNALLANGSTIHADQYLLDVHGPNLFCIDKCCRAPVFFVKGNEDIRSHFKTSGKNDSVHKEGCAFYRQLTFEESMKKIEEFESHFQKVEPNSQQLIRINLNSIDPDRITKQTERNNEKKNEEIKIKSESNTPPSVASLKGVVKLLTMNELDVLSQCQVAIRGNKRKLSELILSVDEAHKLLWSVERLSHEYFIYGQVERVIKLEKVMYISFIKKEHPFSLVIFQRHFPYFEYDENALVGKHVLVYGELVKNHHKGNRSQMVIKSSKYIEPLKSILVE
ncbi:hypothetical protein [Bacillus altitudinis]|uniref:hypothetical protein n=1 Tax=Bacillus altitudinis TaxID=293387 RepID=UPI002281B9E8|nr:hypothetical protein [Bacillus altitudinis]MCY7454266.1 hypothetical protein [Bacillus altitudinis]